ncbi:GW dipeptide domain-containing protein [Enterococcus sp. CSURQ0835]|uniref:GW dipeptide domain-containing protein n=1 Tax=Enterococcus sp. CSURQ0835 TaxID=2681394 RepID=UPI0013575FB2|nr:GW dipeptide domain-containing protein [Enterococcus sp. CSURQ0835]
MKKIFLSCLGGFAALACLSVSASAADEGSQTMFRLYNPNSGEHFYTAREAERDSLVSAGWNYEGLGWTAPQKSNVPVYRVYNPNDGDHHYTTSRGETEVLVQKGWQDEGIGWYSSEVKQHPIYRAYNPNAKAGAHHYTLQNGEIQALTAKGWDDEGIGWYALGQPTYGQQDIQSITHLTNQHGRVKNANVLNAAQNGQAVVIGNTGKYDGYVATLKKEVKTAYGTYYEIAFPDNVIGWIDSKDLSLVKEFWRYTTGGPYPDLNVPNLNIEVSFNQKRTYVKSGDRVLYTLLSQNVRPDYYARIGSYRINSYRVESFWSIYGGANYAIGWYDALYLFHSVGLAPKGGDYDAGLADRLGVVGDGISAGCVILSVEDAKWFYEKIPTGTPVNIHW